MQSHVNVQNETDEFVMEHLISYEKVPVLVHELLSIECWRVKVYPHLVDLDFCEKSTMTAYMVMYHEATVISLLEAILYHKESVEATEDSSMDLADYCFRQIGYLNSMPPYDEDDDAPQTTKAMLDATGQEQLEEQTKKMPFEIATKAVSIMRYLVENCTALPLSCLTRMLNTNDLPCAMVPLITDSPWYVQNSKPLSQQSQVESRRERCHSTLSLSLPVTEGVHGTTTMSILSRGWVSSNGCHTSFDVC